MCRISFYQVQLQLSMSLRRLLYFIFFSATGCVEPYEFVIQNNEPGLAVEAYISDKSFNETLDYPSDGRYFTVKLRTTSNVTNIHDNPVQFAQVQLFNDAGESWEYLESAPGIYTLFNDEFSAVEAVRYKLTIKLPDESAIESDWVQLPVAAPAPMREIVHREENIQKYKIELGKEVIVTAKGIRTEIAIPENNTGKSIFYRWSFVPHWIYKAPFASGDSPGFICWVTDPFYIRNYSLLQMNGAGSIKKDLFFMETIRNERIFEKFSALIVEQVMHEEYFNFWKEMQERNESGAIFNKPPFNLYTNYQVLSGDARVSGYFGIVREQAKRWYFDKTELSYYVDNTLARDCSVPFQDPAPECFDCLEYSKGTPSNIKPVWWID
jgi:hypothetical protein